MSRGMARPAMGVRWGGEAYAAAQPATGRREQALPPALVRVAGAGRAKIEEARWPLDGHPTVSACASTFFRKASNMWKTTYNPSAIISNNLQCIC